MSFNLTPAFSAEDGLVQVLHADTDTPVFQCWHANFNKYAYLIDKYRCRVISLMCIGSESIALDFNLIKNPGMINFLMIQFGGGDIHFKYWADITQGMTKLKRLKVSGKIPEGFPSIDSMPNLDKLEIDYQLNREDWMNSVSISDLKVNGLKADNLCSLSRMKSLTRLCIVQSSIASLLGIEELHKLKTLSIVACKRLKDVKHLTLSKSLTAIQFEKMPQLKEWDFLEIMPQLEHLSLHKANDIKFLECLPKLRFFYVEKVLTNDLSPQQEHPSLTNVLHAEQERIAAGLPLAEKYRFGF